MNRNPQADQPQPHDHWAKYYDYAYRRTHGAVMGHLTFVTLNEIMDILPEGTIIDFGAGTGRLAVPLREKGYQVHAVDPSGDMLKRLESKRMIRSAGNIPSYVSTIADYDGPPADMALAVFTVLNYIITNEEMIDSLQTMVNSLRQGGYLLFDLPSRALFGGVVANVQTHDFQRIASVLPHEGYQKNIYMYHETCSGTYDGEPFTYETNFHIRYWNPHYIQRILEKMGMRKVYRAMNHFRGTGSEYMLFQKQ